MPLIFSSHNSDMAFSKAENSDPRAGGTVVFTGQVRAFNHRKEVAFLHYEAHVALAASMFLDLEYEAQQRFGVFSISAVHRIGRVEVGQEAVHISVTAGHRHEAFLACRYIIDELKRVLPIWRKEVYADGSFSFEQGAGCTHQTINSFEHQMRPTAVALLARGISFEKLQQKRVLLVGAGGLGCPLAIHLQALGIGHITIFDGDKVELSNLARQFVYKESDIGFNKSQIVKRFIEERNQRCFVDSIKSFIDEKKSLEIAGDYDVLIDATDCKYTKRILKRAAFLTKRPLVSGSVYQSEGEVSVYKPHELGACLGCFDGSHAASSLSCATTGVLAHACGMVAALMAEKSLAVLSDTFVGQCEITIVDVLNANLRTLAIGKDRHCSICGITPASKNTSQRKLVRLNHDLI
jgi:sulfur-carrier protein adenylyltransferase/sulfurtransferase